MGGVHAEVSVGAGMSVPGVQQGTSRNMVWDVRLASRDASWRHGRPVGQLRSLRIAIRYRDITMYGGIWEGRALGGHQQDAFGDAVLKYADWLYFVVYCILALLMAWYIKKTGQQNETLQQISNTVSARLTFKHRVLFRILRFIYRKKKKKKEEKK